MGMSLRWARPPQSATPTVRCFDVEGVRGRGRGRRGRGGADRCVVCVLVVDVGGRRATLGAEPESQATRRDRGEAW